MVLGSKEEVLVEVMVPGQTALVRRHAAEAAVEIGTFRFRGN
jgi:hypothetical protein